MQFIQTSHFKRDYKKLSFLVQKQADKKLRILIQNINHPSLRIKKVQKYQNIFEGSITKDYRFLFQITSDVYILLRIEHHDILEKG